MLEKVYNIETLREAARQRLPAPVFSMIECAAESELTARRNVAAFDDVKLLPKALVDVATVSTTTKVLGQTLQWPVYCSPTGGTRGFHPGGELAVARAAAKTGTMYGLSTFSNYDLETVAAASDGPKLFQLYICRDRDFTRSLVLRAKQAGYTSLCITIDTAVVGGVESHLRFGMMPGRIWPLSTVLSFAQHPLWVWKHLSDGPLIYGHFKSVQPGSPWDPTVTWKDIREMAELWGGPVALKGVMSPDVARRAADEGVTAVIVSNHGGRSVDGAAASIEALPEIVEAVGDRIEVIMDGGVRRGVHVLKALALGAKACAIGRPYLYGLVAGGEAGVVKALTMLKAEFVRAMQLAGCPDIASIDRGLLTQR